jgi:hydrogenase maturation protein HypF
MLDRGFNVPLTSSCGRLFDAVSALLGLRLRIDYEGQAAIVLEEVQDMTVTRGFFCPVLETGTGLVLDTRTLFARVLEARSQGETIPVISRRFHLGLMHGLRDWALRAADRTGVRIVGLSGGVMQNRTLTRELPDLLRRAGLDVLVHTLVPPNDACISLGQAAYGRRKLQGQRS